MSRFLTILTLFVIFITSGTAFVCDNEIGVIADPDDCRGFYICDFEHYEHFQCSPGYLFDPDLLVCNYAYEVDCGDRPIPGVSTTTSASTVSTTTVTTTAGTTTASTSTASTTTASTTTTTEMNTSDPPFDTTTKPTTSKPTTTTSENGDYNLRYPDKVMALYIVLADDTEPGYHTDDEWSPQLYSWQQEGANVLFFTFINPDSMIVPNSFVNLAASRGTNAEGAVPQDTMIIFAIGGIQYSTDYNPWHWLTSKEAAEAMAIEVATWPDKYGCDGIDLDIEEGAGGQADSGVNMVHFVNKLRSIKPDIVIGQPTYGYPAVEAANEVINQSWDLEGNLKNVADSVGIMVYEGTQSLDYVKNFVNGADQWEGFPIKVNVNSKAVMLGSKGSSSSATIIKLAEEAVAQDLLGIMVWYASVIGGPQYAVSWDASIVEDSQNGYIKALKYFEGRQ